MQLCLCGCLLSQCSKHLFHITNRKCLCQVPCATFRPSCIDPLGTELRILGKLKKTSYLGRIFTIFHITIFDPLYPTFSFDFSFVWFSIASKAYIHHHWWFVYPFLKFRANFSFLYDGITRSNNDFRQWIALHLTLPLRSILMKYIILYSPNLNSKVLSIPVSGIFRAIQNFISYSYSIFALQSKCQTIQCFLLRHKMHKPGLCKTGTQKNWIFKQLQIV